MVSKDTEIEIYDRLTRMKLKTLRKHHHMTQSMMSEISGLSRSTISNIESEDPKASSPRLDSIIAYLYALNYQINFEDKDEYKKEEMISLEDDYEENQK